MIVILRGLIPGCTTLKATRGGGVGEVKNIVFDMFCISRSRAGCKKIASIDIIPSGSYEFFNLAHNTITIRVQTSNRDISKQF